MPGLGTLLVGEDPGSFSYVGGKHRDSAELGSDRTGSTFRRRHPRPRCAAAIAGVNSDPRVTGYIVQVPLPAGIDENAMPA